MENIEAILKRPIIDHDIEAILHRPIKSFPNGWKAGFKELLMQACGEYKNKYGEPLSPEIVLLTGGGSHMSFTGDACREVFGSAIVNPDPEPFYTVARGLAEFGRWEYRVSQFHQAIADFCDSPKLEKELQRQIDSLAKIVVKFFIGKPFADGVYRPMFHELREGTLSSSRIGDFKTYIYQRLAQWLKTPEGLQAQQEVINDIAKLLDPFIVPETDKICDRFHIKHGSLQLLVTANPEIFFFKKYPELGFFEWLAYKEFDGLLYVADHIIPVPIRKLVPKKIVDLTMDYANVAAKMEGPLRAHFTQLSPDAKKQFINNVRMQIKEQLEERAQEVERLIK